MANEQKDVQTLLDTLGADRFGLIVVDGETKKAVTEISFLKHAVSGRKTKAESRVVLNYGINLLRESLVNHLGLNEPDESISTPPSTKCVND